MPRIAARKSALNIGHGPRTIGLIDPLDIWGAVDVFRFDLALTTFTPGMDKRLSPGPFYTAPVVQGRWQTDSGNDAVTAPRGTALGNAVTPLYANIDPYQGSVVLWITPEWDGDDGQLHYIAVFGSVCYLLKTAGDLLQFTYSAGNSVSVDISTWTAGTTYCIVISWDIDNTIDGTNHLRLSVSNNHTFGVSSAFSVASLFSTIRVGSYSASLGQAGDAIIEGLTIYRRVLTDDNGYGVDAGNGDELTAIYAAGAGSDPTLITGSWDVVFCLPTNSTAEELTTGTGEAWSHPHGSNIPDVWGMWDGGYLQEPYCVESTDAAGTVINCGSAAALDDLPTAANFQVEFWFRWDATAAVQQGLVAKGANGVSGWYIIGQSDDTVVGFVRLDGTPTGGASANTARDGKFHHVVFDYVHATRTARLALDGIWGSAVVGAGNYISDAALSLTMCDLTGFGELTGAMGAVRISDVQRYTPGTDFVPPRTTWGVDGNTVEQWNLDEGTGVTCVAQVVPGAPPAGHDGTITNGSWSSIWEVEGTPVVPQSHTFDGAATSIDATSGANIDNLITAAGGMTAEIYARIDGAGGGGFGRLFDKSGWYVYANGINVTFFVDYDTTNAQALATLPADGVFHHIRVTYRETASGGDNIARVWIDGVLEATSGAAVGNYVGDAANTLYVGNSAAGTRAFDGAIGSVRLSNTVRNTISFVPYARTTAPANDANAHLLYAMTEGAGTAVADTSGNGYNGTITPGSGVWLNTPDMESDEPGARVFSQGYNIGSDGADDGITIIETVTAETDYVLRAVISYGQSGRAWPELYLYDNTNAAQIGADYDLPRLVDVHTGGAAAPLTNANGSFTQQLVGWTLDNITQGTTGTVTAISGDKTTVTGGPNFNNGDTYRFRPPSSRPYCRHPNATEAIFVFRTPAGCTSIDIKVRNDAGEGVMQIHQLEVLESLLDFGDMEFFGPIAASRTLNVGTETGVLANSEWQDGVYYTVNELAIPGPAWQVEFNFTVQAGVEGVNIRLFGKYNGNPGHIVNVDAWNYITTGWDNLGTIASAGADANHSWAFTNPAQQTSGTNIRIRFNHVSNGSAGHVFNVDYLWIEVDPAIVRGWANYNLDSGDSVQELAVVHGGASSLEYDTGAGNFEGILQNVVVTQDAFFGVGCWSYGDGGVGLQVAPNGDGVLQYDPAVVNVDTAVTAVWSPVLSVWRKTNDSDFNWILMSRSAVATGSRYVDDAYLFELDDVSLTVTPASQPNSLEGTGIRVDGKDTLTQPAPVALLTPTAGDIWFRWTPRHTDALAVSFGNISAWLFRIDGGANNYIDLVWNVANNLRLQFNANGAGVQIGDWATGGGFFVPGTSYLMRVRYAAAWMRLYVDAVLRTTILAPTGFAWTDPMVVYWGSTDASIYQADAVYSGV